VRRRLWRDQRGFTLIELVVVITIIGVLVAVIVPAVAGYTDNAKKKAAKADAKNIQTALLVYESEYGVLPDDSGTENYTWLKDTLDNYVSLPSEGNANFTFGSYELLEGSKHKFKLKIYAKDTDQTPIYIYKSEIIEGS